MLWTILAVLLGIWLIGLVLNVIGSLIHIALVIGLVLLVIKLVQSKSRTRS